MTPAPVDPHAAFRRVTTLVTQPGMEPTRNAYVSPFLDISPSFAFYARANPMA